MIEFCEEVKVGGENSDPLDVENGKSGFRCVRSVIVRYMLRWRVLPCKHSHGAPWNAGER